MDEYNASSIKILKPVEAAEKFEWLEIEQLALKHNRSPEWIERGFEACWRAGVDKSYFIRRYLEKDSAVELNTLVSDTFRDLLREGVQYC